MTDKKQGQERTEEVQVTLAEASDLFDRSWEGEHKNLFRKHFTPDNASQLVEHLVHRREIGERDNLSCPYYTSGELYIVSRDKKGIKIIPMKHITEKHWKKGANNKFYSHGAIKEGANGNSYCQGVCLHEVYSQLEYLDLEKIEREHGYLGVEIPLDGCLPPAELDASQICDTGKYEKWLKSRNNEDFEERRRDGKGIKVLNTHPDTSPLGRFVAIPFLPLWSTEPQEWNPLLTRLEGLSKADKNSLLIRGDYRFPKYPQGQTLDAFLLSQYSPLKDVGNGIFALNEDRVPLYLKRRLGIGGGR